MVVTMNRLVWRRLYRLAEPGINSKVDEGNL